MEFAVNVSQRHQLQDGKVILQRTNGIKMLLDTLGLKCSRRRLEAGSAQTHWRSLSAPPNPLATIRGLFLRVGRGERGKGRIWEGQGGGNLRERKAGKGEKGRKKDNGIGFIWI